MEPINELATMKPRKKRKEKITYYELLELEKKRNEPNSYKITIKKSFPIASDGFIPNSVVKKFFKIIDEEPKQPEKKIWKLKWKPPAKEKTVSERSTPDYNGQTYYYDLTSDEEEQEQETKKINIDDEDDNQLFKPKTFKSNSELDELISRLSEHSWFKMPNEINLDTLVTLLVNKVIERNDKIHKDVVDYLKEINSKFKLASNLKEWVVEQLEEELDGTNHEIILRNLDLLSSIGIETYNIDMAMLKLLDQRDKNLTFKEKVSEFLIQIAGVDQNEIKTSLANMKKLQTPKYKNNSNFKLKHFLEELKNEEEGSKKLSKSSLNVEDETNSEIFKQILKEDWIAAPIKEGLKTLKDFLTYLLKSLKTIKSKIFYEKVCNYLQALINEFKLANSNWEKEMINHFTYANSNSKMPEQLRLIDFENITKCFPNLTDQTTKKEILVEMLKTVAYDTRPSVPPEAKQILKKFSNLIDFDLDNLINFYSSKNLSQNFKLTWDEALNLYRTKPGISAEELQETFKSSTNTSFGNDTDSGISSSFSSITSKSSKKEKKSKKIVKNKKKEKNQTKPEMIREKTEPLDEKIESKPEQMKQPGAKVDEHKNSLKVHENKDPEKSNLSKSSLLPNRENTWRYYRERTEREKSQTKQDDEQNYQAKFQNLAEKVIDVLLNDQQSINTLNMTESFHQDSSKALADDEQDDQKLDSFSSVMGSIVDDIEFDENEKQAFNLNSIDKAYALKLAESEMLRKNSKDLLNGIKKRVILNEYPSIYNKNESDLNHLNNLSHQDLFLFNKEKGHYLIQPNINSSTSYYSDSNMRFYFIRQNLSRQRVEYNKLMECLVIRGLELHNHYEKLLPISQPSSHVSTRFVPYPYFSDFLVVHPYNTKSSSTYYHKDELKTTRNKSFNKSQTVSRENTMKLYDFNVIDANEKRDERTDNLSFINESVKQQSSNWRSKDKKAPKPNNILQEREAVLNLDMTHLYLLNKLLISYGAENIRQYYSNANNSFKGQFRKLNAKIPYPIIPLIWNDPVVQKLAMVISNSNKRMKSDKKNNMTQNNNLKLEKLRTKYLKPIFDIRQQRHKTFYGKRDADLLDDSLTISGFSSSKHIPVQKHKPIKSFKEPYYYWPIDKSQDDLLGSKSYKTMPFYSHSYQNLKQQEILKSTRNLSKYDNNKLHKSQPIFLPPLSYKAILNEHHGEK